MYSSFTTIKAKGKENHVRYNLAQKVLGMAVNTWTIVQVCALTYYNLQLQTTEITHTELAVSSNKRGMSRVAQWHLWVR